MKPLFVAAALVLSAASPVLAAPDLQPALQPLAFMVGHWRGENGKVENGASDKGVVAIEPAVGGAALLSRGHTEVFKGGKPIESFDQLLLIYPEDGDLHADYFDGTHVIHYVSAVVDPGKAVTFNTAATPGPPRFRLTYRAKTPDRFSITFEMAPPGSETFQTVAVGDAVRD